MKLKLSPKTKQLGAALITALVVGSILCISIVGYLSVSEQQTLLSARSQSWNMAITVVEAGIEEGLQQCYNNYWNLAADGWNKSGNLYTRNRTFPDGSVSSITIDNSIVNAPTVRAQATVVAPTFVQRGGLTTFFATGGQTQTTMTSPSVARAVLVRTSRGSLFRKAMAARNSINLNGNNIFTDSFDSADPMKSRFGAYDGSWYSGDKGDVACNASIINSVNVGNADIFGHVATGPGGTVALGANGSVGAHTWVAAHPNGIEPGWVTDDSNFTVPTTDFPYNASSAGVLTVPNNAGTFVTTTNQVTTTNFSNTTVYPNPVPWSGVTTNMVNPWTTNTVSPNPPAYGEVINTFWTSNVLTYPNPGAYLPPVYTNYAGQSGNIKYYTFQSIRNYAWPTLTYNYTLYGTNAISTTNHYDHIINVSGNYYTTSLSGDTLVTVPDVRLIVANGMDLSANSHNSFTVANGAITTGTPFQLYVGGTSFSISSDQVHNLGLYSGSFVVYCAPSVTSVSFGGNSEFSGVLVAPNVDLTLNGGGSGYMDFVGSLMVRSVTMTGHYHFHWDEALGRVANNPRVLITSWDEVTPSLAGP
jgi:hypothetical protein